MALAGGILHANVTILKKTIIDFVQCSLCVIFVVEMNERIILIFDNAELFVHRTIFLEQREQFGQTSARR